MKLKLHIPKIKPFLLKHKWLITFFLIVITISYPFLLLFLNWLTGKSIGELYTFGLSLKDFLTPWIAFWALIGAAINVWFMQRRVSLMEKQRTDQQIRWEKQDIEQEKSRLEQQSQFKEQIENQNTQIQIQQKQRRDARFSSGVELLGNPNESARIGGAYNLYFLASEFPDDYLNPVCEILCAHVRTITSDKAYQETFTSKPSNEIQTIVNLLFDKGSKEETIFNDCTKNLASTFLCGSNFNRKIISNVLFFDALLNSVDFSESRLKNIKFNYATFIHTTFNVSQLNNVRFSSSILNNVMFNDSELINVEFTNQVSLSNVTFIDSKLNGTVFYGKLENVSFMGVKFNNIGHDDVCFMGVLSNVDFRKAHLEYVDFSYSVFENVDFSGSLLNCTDFTGTLLEKHIHTVTNKGRSLVLTKPQKEEPKSVPFPDSEQNATPIPETKPKNIRKPKPQ